MPPKDKARASFAKNKKNRGVDSLQRLNLLTNFPASVQRQCQSAEDACDKNDMGVVIRNLDHFIFHTDLVIKATSVLQDAVLPPLWHRPAQIALAKALDRHAAVGVVVCNALQALCNIAVQDPAFECQTIRAMLKVADQHIQSGAPIILFLELVSALITPSSPAPKLRYSLTTNQTALAQAGCVELCLNIIACRLKSNTPITGGNVMPKKKKPPTGDGFKMGLPPGPSRLRNEQLHGGIMQLALHVLYLLTRENSSCLRALCMSTAWQPDWRIRKAVKNLPKKMTRNQILLAKGPSIQPSEMFRKLLAHDMTRTNPQLAVAAVRLLTVVAERCPSLDWKLVTLEVVKLLGSNASILDFTVTAVEALHVLKAGPLIPSSTYAIAHGALGEKHAHSEFSVVTPRLEAHRMHLRDLLSAMMAPITVAPPARVPDDNESKTGAPQGVTFDDLEATTGVAKKRKKISADDREDASSEASSESGVVTSPANLARKVLRKSYEWKTALGSDAIDERLVEDLTPAINRFVRPLRPFTEDILVSAQLADDSVSFTAKLCTKTIDEALHTRLQLLEQTPGRSELAGALARTLKRQQYRLPPLGLTVNIHVKDLPDISKSESISSSSSKSGSESWQD